MRIAILAKTKTAPGAVALAKAARAQHHRAEIYDIHAAHTKQAMLQNHVLIPRFGHATYAAAIDIVQEFTRHKPDAITAVSASGIEASFDKFQTYQRLLAARVPTPITYEITARTNGQQLAKYLPLILKPTDENRGRGIAVARSLQELEAGTRQLLATYGRGIAQEFIAEAGGRDIRAFVVGDEVVAAMERTAPEGSDIANLAQGGTARPVTLTAQEQELAVRVAQLFGAVYAGVDILRSNRGALILEINASPGFKIMDVIHVDVPRLVIEYLAELHEGEEE